VTSRCLSNRRSTTLHCRAGTPETADDSSPNSCPARQSLRLHSGHVHKVAAGLPLIVVSQESGRRRYDAVRDLGGSGALRRQGPGRSPWIHESRTDPRRDERLNFVRRSTLAGSEGATGHSMQEVVWMGRIMEGPAWLSRKLRRLRSLATGEDTDPWYEERRAKREKPPNVGPNLGGGG
jgi:hypothetical protein